MIVHNVMSSRESQNPRVLVADFFGAMRSLAVHQVGVDKPLALLQWNRLASRTLAFDQSVEAGRFADLT